MQGMKHIARAAGERLERLLREFPVVLVLGPGSAARALWCAS